MNGFLWSFFVGMAILGCHSTHQVAAIPHGKGDGAPMEAIVPALDTLSLEEREQWITEELLDGHIPKSLAKWSNVTVSIVTAQGKQVKATYYVTPDYLSIGTDRDFFRVPLTPRTAQSVATAFHCFLPTRKMVDDIYAAATVKLQPMPLTEARESVSTFYEHHLIIERQRKGRKGLIAGIKKDVVISSAIADDERPNRVAIYGWHKLDGIPIQPLYTGHVDWYVDYSHGIRLVHEWIDIGGRMMHYKDVLRDAELHRLLCDEERCDFYGYP